MLSRPGTGRVTIPFVEKIPLTFNKDVDTENKTGTVQKSHA